eukprot:g9916.t1
MPTTVLANASLTAKLQSPTGRVDLEDKRTARGASVSRPNPAPLLGPSENLDMIVEHTLEELGTHTLRVTVKYQVAGAPEGSEPRSMRKFYRFSVMNPVTLSSSCTAVRGTPFVELQLINTTQMDLLLDSCNFIPEGGVEASLIGGGRGGDALSASPRFVEDEEDGDDPEAAGAPRTTQISPGTGAGGGGPGTSAASRRRRDRWWRSAAGGGVEGDVAGRRAAADGCLLTAVERFDGRVLLRPEESHQLMYSVRPREGAAAGAAVSSRGGSDGAAPEEQGGEGGFGEGSHTLGRVKVAWRTTTGESGSVQSGPVVFEGPERPEVEVTVDGLPDVLKLGRVAECVATVRNRSKRPMTLQLQFRTDGMIGVYVHGQSFRNLGELLPGDCVRCPLQLLALVAGLHELRGCTVADMHTAQEFPQGKLRDLLVEFPEDDDEDGEVVAAEGGQGRAAAGPAQRLSRTGSSYLVFNQAELMVIRVPRGTSFLSPKPLLASLQRGRSLADATASRNRAASPPPHHRGSGRGGGHDGKDGSSSGSGPRMLGAAGVLAPAQLELQSDGGSEDDLGGEPLTWTESLGSGGPLFYSGLLRWQASALQVGLGLDRSAVPLRMDTVCNPDKQSRVRNLVYTGGRVRKVRMSYLDVPDMQVYSSVAYSAPGFDFPLLSLSAMAMGHVRVLALDLCPLFPGAQYAAKYASANAKLRAIRDKYPEMRQELKREYYKGSPFFSENMMYARWGPEEDASGFMENVVLPAFKETVEAYVEIVNTAPTQSVPGSPSEQAVLERHAEFDRFHSEREQVRPVMTANFGPSFAETYVSKFLFAYRAGDDRAGRGQYQGNREAIRLYREILKATRLFHWCNENGEPCRDAEVPASESVVLCCLY